MLILMYLFYYCFHELKAQYNKQEMYLSWARRGKSKASVSQFFSSESLLSWQSPLVGTQLLLQEVGGQAPVVVGQVGLCVLVQVVDQALELGGVDVHGDEA